MEGTDLPRGKSSCQGSPTCTHCQPARRATMATLGPGNGVTLWLLARSDHGGEHGATMAWAMIEHAELCVQRKSTRARRCSR
jgi:hypothetical protein